ncbi:hypothetical protein BDM02DRAFT_687172 [Thelephora ganbajun]|uniref:Uncharacterized protein n=1 Tax=Thelephora ganbajun TaxID=370292 RepID=A0ACB6Z783_THEGA|nr:hypothetical protein BDM02DRAFT_687172 [Thelephora ganbajun]
MVIQDAREFHGLDQLNTPEVSKFISEITEKSPAGFTSWKTVPSAVEVKRKKDMSGWAPLPVFNHRDSQASVIRDAEQWLDKKLDDSRSMTPVSLVTLVSSKRTTSAAGMEASAEISGSKRQRIQKVSTKMATQTLVVQNGIYAAEKFSDSLSISHVLNLLAQSDLLWISWIDREGAILSSGFGFFGSLPLMFVLLLVLQRFERHQWGYIAELTHSVPLCRVNDDGILGEDAVSVNFYPEDKVYSSWSLLGRATNVVGANVEDNGNAEGECAEVQGEAKGSAVGGAPVKDSADIQRTQGEAVKDIGNVEDEHHTADMSGADPIITANNNPAAVSRGMACL